MELKQGQRKVGRVHWLFDMRKFVRTLFAPTTGYKFPGKYHGVLLIPEGLIESIPEMYSVIQVGASYSYMMMS